MSAYQRPAPKRPPETPQSRRARHRPSREAPRPTPEVGRKPRFIFTDFASI